jgi:hypothetical protein
VPDSTEPTTRPLGEPAPALALRLTLLLIVFAGWGEYYQRVPLLCLAGLGLVVPPLLRTPWLWAGIGGVLTWYLIGAWPEPDNHVYLAIYWCIAIALANACRIPRAALSVSARWLIGLCFAFAWLWKIVLSGGEFISGATFQMVFLTDPRFTDFTLAVSGLSEHALLEQRAILHKLPFEGFDEMQLGTARLVAVARTFSWWTILIELALAVAFLSQPGTFASEWRNRLLAVFTFTTYSLATVAGFGWLLLAMAAAQCDDEEEGWRKVFVGLFFVVLVYDQLPWARVLLSMLE